MRLTRKLPLVLLFAAALISSSTEPASATDAGTGVVVGLIRIPGGIPISGCRAVRGLTAQFQVRGGFVTNLGLFFAAYAGPLALSMRGAQVGCESVANANGEVSIGAFGIRFLLSLALYTFLGNHISSLGLTGAFVRVGAVLTIGFSGTITICSPGCLSAPYTFSIVSLFLPTSADFLTALISGALEAITL